MREWLIALNVMGLGFFVPITIILGILGGRWLDQKTGTLPLWSIVGLVLGILVAAYGVYQMLKPYMTENNGKNRKE